VKFNIIINDIPFIEGLYAYGGKIKTCCPEGKALNEKAGHQY
jgi:hypothetical protein